MATPRRHRRGGRVTSATGREPPLLKEIRRALASDHPFELLEWISSMLAALDSNGETTIRGPDPDELLASARPRDQG